MYIPYKCSLQASDYISDRYKDKIVIAKRKIFCSNGVFQKGSVIYIEPILNIVREYGIYSTIKLYACSERLELGDKLIPLNVPYVRNDTIELFAKDLNKLAEILESMFEIDNEKTEYNNEYMKIGKKVISYIDDYSSIRKICHWGSALALIGLIHTATIHFGKLHNFFPFNETDLHFYRMTEIILVLLVCVFQIVPFAFKRRLENKTKDFKVRADSLYSKIIH